MARGDLWCGGTLSLAKQEPNWEGYLYHCERCDWDIVWSGTDLVASGVPLVHRPREYKGQRRLLPTGRSRSTEEP